MPPRRRQPPSEPITLRVDGKEVQAREGEPVAVALTASGRLVLGRSIKYHRPRGAACYAGRCDGCLMRVDGVPNVMTCLEPARDGMEVETQNVVGSAHADLLSVTDWFYPHGMDHHEMFTWSKPVNRVMQRFARRIAGIGRLPDEPVDPVAPREIDADVLVVGGGPSGLVAATECAREGARVHLLEDADALGGHLRLFPGEVDPGDGTPVPARELGKRLADELARTGCEVHRSAAATGVYEDPGRGSPVPVGPDRAEEAATQEDATEQGAAEGEEEDEPQGPSSATTPRLTVVASGHEQLLRARTRRLIVATGLHEGAVPIEGNDLPGVLGARAALTLVDWGVQPGERVAVVGSGPWADGLEAALREAGSEVVGPHEIESVSRIRGRPRVKAIDVTDGERTRRERCDAVAIVPPASSAYETAAQAGARVPWRDGRFVVEASPEDGETAAPWLRAVGECTGVDSLAEGLAQARAAARAVMDELRQAGELRQASELRQAENEP